MADEGTENFWPSFTDLTSTIALILFVFVLLAFIQNLISGRNLEFLRAQLDDTAKRLESSHLEVSRSEKKLMLLETELNKTMAEIEAGRTRLALSEEQVDEQKEIIAESNRELGTLRAKLQGIAVLRVDVLSKVKKHLEAELGDTAQQGEPLVRIADNGNIVLNESLLFEYDSYKIKKNGKRLLKTLSQAFANLLGDPGVRENIDVILVQGHTDDRGSAAYNRELSAKRSGAVLNYMFEVSSKLGESYGAYFASSAYSEFRPVSSEKTEDAYEQNRRIEISLVLKDANVQRVIDNYLKSINPVLSEQQPPGDSQAEK